MAKLNDTQINGDLKVTGNIDGLNSDPGALFGQGWARRAATTNVVQGDVVGAPFIVLDNNKVCKLEIRSISGGTALVLQNVLTYNE